MTPFSIVVALDSDHGIGKDGKLPWHLPGDFKHFKEITCTTEDHSKKNVVMMGRKTWESLHAKFKPLPDRINVVLTRNKDLSLPSGVLRAENFKQFFSLLTTKKLIVKFEKIFVIGGEQIFQEALKYPICQKIYATHILKSFHCDTFFPAFKDQFEAEKSSPPICENSINYYFCEYSRKRLF